MSIPQGTPILMTTQRVLKLGETKVGPRRQTEQVGLASYGSARTGLRRPSPAAPLFNRWGSSAGPQDLTEIQLEVALFELCS